MVSCQTATYPIVIKRIYILWYIYTCLEIYSIGRGPLLIHLQYLSFPVIFLAILSALFSCISCHRVTPMETSQPLSIESFSYSWLVNLKPSLESLDNSLRASLDASDEASFIEMDPRMPPSKRFFRNSQDFKFDFPISQSPLTLVHADELFSNGYVMPLFVDPLKMEAYDVSDSTSALPTSSHAPKTVVSACKPQRCSSLRRCRRLSKQIVQKYLDFLRPLYRRIRGHRSSSRDENIDSKVQVMKNWVYSAETSPRISVAYSVDDCWRRSCDSESSIYEAVLHCKRSNGK